MEELKSSQCGKIVQSYTDLVPLEVLVLKGVMSLQIRSLRRETLNNRYFSIEILRSEYLNRLFDYHLLMFTYSPRTTYSHFSGSILKYCMFLSVLMVLSSKILPGEGLPYISGGSVPLTLLAAGLQPLETNAGVVAYVVALITSLLNSF